MAHLQQRVSCELFSYVAFKACIVKIKEEGQRAFLLK